MANVVGRSGQCRDKIQQTRLLYERDENVSGKRYDNECLDIDKNDLNDEQTKRSIKSDLIDSEVESEIGNSKAKETKGFRIDRDHISKENISENIKPLSTQNINKLKVSTFIRHSAQFDYNDNNISNLSTTINSNAKDNLNTVNDTKSITKHDSQLNTKVRATSKSDNEYVPESNIFSNNQSLVNNSHLVSKLANISNSSVGRGRERLNLLLRGNVGNNLVIGDSNSIGVQNNSRNKGDNVDGDEINDRIRVRKESEKKSLIEDDKMGQNKPMGVDDEKRIINNEYFDTKDERNGSNDLMNSTRRHLDNTVNREVEDKRGIEKSTKEVAEDMSRLRPNINKTNFNLDRFRHVNIISSDIKLRTNIVPDFKITTFITDSRRIDVNENKNKYNNKYLNDSPNESEQNDENINKNIKNIPILENAQTKIKSALLLRVIKANDRIK